MSLARFPLIWALVFLRAARLSFARFDPELSSFLAADRPIGSGPCVPYMSCCHTADWPVVSAPAVPCLHGSLAAAWSTLLGPHSAHLGCFLPAAWPTVPGPHSDHPGFLLPAAWPIDLGPAFPNLSCFLAADRPAENLRQCRKDRQRNRPSSDTLDHIDEDSVDPVESLLEVFERLPRMDDRRVIRRPDLPKGAIEPRPGLRDFLLEAGDDHRAGLRDVRRCWCRRRVDSGGPAGSGRRRPLGLVRRRVRG